MGIFNSRQIKTAVYFILILIFTTTASVTINYYKTPKVYAIPIQKGRLANSSEIFDCIIPKGAIKKDGTIFLAYPLQSVMGQRYIVTSSEIAILDEDEYNYAVDIPYTGIDYRIIISSEREISDGIEVIISSAIYPVKIRSDNNLLILQTSADNTALSSKIANCGILNNIESTSSTDKLILNVYSKAELIPFIANIYEKDSSVSVIKAYEIKQSHDFTIFCAIVVIIVLTCTIAGKICKGIVLKVLLNFIAYCSLIAGFSLLPYISFSLPDTKTYLYIISCGTVIFAFLLIYNFIKRIRYNIFSIYVKYKIL